jgi:hypothetical protein
MCFSSQKFFSVARSLYPLGHRRVCLLQRTAEFVVVVLVSALALPHLASIILQLQVFPLHDTRNDAYL